MNFVSYKEIIENQISENKLQRNNIVDNLISQYNNDTLNNNGKVQNENLLSQQNELPYDYQLIELYVSQNKLSQSQQLLNSLPSKYEFTDLEQSEYNEMTELIDVLTGIDSLNYFNMTSDQKNTLYSLAQNGNTKAKAIAQGILFLVDTVEFPIPEIVIHQSNKHIAKDSTKHVFAFEIAPNPAKDYFVVTYDFADEKLNNPKLEITDANNLSVISQNLTLSAYQVLVPTENLKSGIYICKLINSEKIEATKIVVVGENLTPKVANLQNNSTNSEQILIYPNPAKNAVTIYTSIENDIEVEIVNSNGKIVFDAQMT